jgi:hypothetical protein
MKRTALIVVEDAADRGAVVQDHIAGRVDVDRRRILVDDAHGDRRDVRAASADETLR